MGSRRRKGHNRYRIFLPSNGADRANDAGDPVAYKIALLPEALERRHILQKIVDGAEVGNNVKLNTVVAEFLQHRIEQNQVPDAVGGENE